MTIAILTGTTCGFSCWYAHEEVCRCSCYGANHGCLLDESGKQPEKIVKIQGERYRLHFVGTYAEAKNVSRDLLDTLGPANVNTSTVTGYRYHAPYWANGKGSRVWVKIATESQLQWPEVIKVAQIDKTVPYIVWVIEPWPEPTWCEDECEWCMTRRFENW